MSASKTDVLGAIAAVLFIAAVVAALVWAFGAVATGIDADRWERVDDACWLHVRQVNDVWLTPGHDEPETRTVYCEREAA